MKCKSAEAAERRINEILEARDAGFSELNRLTGEDAAAISSATDRMNAATVSGDLAAYKQARADLDDAKTAQEMHTARFRIFQGEPLISKEEYEELAAAIKAEVTGIKATANEQLFTLAEQMKAIGDDLEDLEKTANRTLYRLQNDLYRNADRARGADGSVIGYNNDRQHVALDDTYGYARKAAEHRYYVQAHTGGKA